MFHWISQPSIVFISSTMRNTALVSLLVIISVSLATKVSATPVGATLFPGQDQAPTFVSSCDAAVAVAYSTHKQVVLYNIESNGACCRRIPFDCRNVPLPPQRCEDVLRFNFAAKPSRCPYSAFPNHFRYILFPIMNEILVAFAYLDRIQT